jgi:hypothetical protein
MSISEDDLSLVPNKRKLPPKPSVDKVAARKRKPSPTGKRRPKRLKQLKQADSSWEREDIDVFGLLDNSDEERERQEKQDRLTMQTNAIKKQVQLEAKTLPKPEDALDFSKPGMKTPVAADAPPFDPKMRGDVAHFGPNRGGERNYMQRTKNWYDDIMKKYN